MSDNEIEDVSFLPGMSVGNKDKITMLILRVIETDRCTSISFSKKLAVVQGNNWY